MKVDAIPLERLLKSRILIVDDVEVNRRVLAHSLMARGYSNIVTATDGSDALLMTQEVTPDLVILDLMMPGMDGFAYCEAIRKEALYDTMPIIVQTALGEMEQKLRAFELGASDYITKPIDPGELNARTKIQLSQKFMTEDLRQYHTIIKAELEAAREMQARLMPAEQQIEMCELTFDMKIAAHFETSSALGGDCWGMSPLSPSQLALYMYDFSGHGITAAMNVFRMHTIMQELIFGAGDPGNFLTTLNRHLYSLLDRDEFATMFYGIIDIGANCLLYSTAAVQPPLLFNSAGEEPLSLDGRGFPLGAIANATYETQYTPFMAGDLLLLYSDGIVETKNSHGQYITLADVKNTGLLTIEEAPAHPAQWAVNKLMNLFHTHNNAGPIRDDVTVNAYWRCHK